MKGVLLHIAAAFAVLILLLTGFFYLWLPYTTNHSESIVVPELSGKSVTEIESILHVKNLRYQIYDSVYHPGERPMTVLTQYPRSGNTVKSNRKIYITVTAINPPQVVMPNLIDASMLNAQMVLQSYGLKVGNITKVPHFAENAVLKQQVKGRDIKHGQMISKGTAIDLVVGDGVSNVELDLPNLVAMDATEAQASLKTLNLEVGSIIYDEKSSEEPGKIVKQKPAFTAGQKIKQGQAVDIWISGENPGKVILTDEETDVQ